MLEVLMVHQVVYVARCVGLVSGVRHLTLREPLFLVIIRQLSPRLIRRVPLRSIHPDHLLRTVRIEHPSTIPILPSIVHLQSLVGLVRAGNVVCAGACTMRLPIRLVQIRAVVGVGAGTHSVRLLNRTDVREKRNWVLLSLCCVQLCVGRTHFCWGLSSVVRG